MDLVQPHASARLPAIPDDFTHPDVRQTLWYVLYVLSQLLLPALGTFAVFESALPLAAKIPLIAVTGCLSGHGLFMMGIAAHEGFHFLLHRNRFVSFSIGIFMSSAIPLFFAVGYFINHWHHHRYTNTDKDPDILIVTRYRTLLSRMLLVRLHFNRHYMKTFAQVMFGDTASIARPVGMTARQLGLLARVNLLAQLMWLSVYAVLAWYSPSLLALLVGVPLGVALVIASLNPYQEHLGTGTAQWQQARSRISSFQTLLMGGVNYHLEHHLYPRVPCWRLARLHRWLTENGHFAGKGSHFEPDYLKSFAVATLPYGAVDQTGTS